MIGPPRADDQGAYQDTPGLATATAHLRVPYMLISLAALCYVLIAISLW